MSEPTHIVVRRASAHNLRGVDVEIPRNALTVFTGVSGSGKSSLVFDTIHQEGQRRFVESLSAYARQFLGQLERPEVEAVEGISPTLSIDQKTVNRNPRSTVGTITEIYDHLRLLMARLGQPRCPICATPISRLGVEQVVDRLLELGGGERLQILGPVIQERKGEYRKELEDLARDGWVRARIDGTIHRLDDPPELERYKKHTIEVVVDRLTPSRGDRTRLVEAVEIALALGDQTVTVLVGDDEHTFSTRRACPTHPDQAVPELEPRLFSFNNPQGACPTCEGLGELAQFEPERLVDRDAPLRDAMRIFNDDDRIAFVKFDRSNLRQIAKGLGVSMDDPPSAWRDDQWERFLHGDEAITWTRPRRRGPQRTPWKGLIPLMDRIWHFTKHKGFKPFRSRRPCPDCHGARLHPIARAVVFRERPIHELTELTVAEAHAFFQEVSLTPDERPIGGLLLSEIRERLGFLHQVGLGYLSLSRSAATLSGGESQRIRLASQVGSALQGVTYVLDEPSIGLHPRDNARLLEAILRLRDRGNTVLVVEHDHDTMLAADHLVDVGPGAGREGGYITAEGPPGAFLQSDCLTAEYLRGDKAIPLPEQRRPTDGPAIRVVGAKVHNLDDLTVSIPTGALTVVTGVSGSGKSSLVFQVLERSVRGLLGDGGVEGCTAIEGLDAIDKLVRINQRPIGRTPRSNPATYTGAMDVIRDLFAATAESRARGYTKSRFSFNVAGGRCEDCGGAGVKTIEMQFLPDVQVPCETCGGARYNRETLDVRFKGLTIAEVLDLPIGEALERFANLPKLARILSTLVDVGLDYVTLGQPSTTLSGGEAQRVKLASELHRPGTGNTLYLLDEPTTGLHVHDVRRLLIALDRLVDQGNTVVIVEHHTDVIAHADHLVDLGPEGGDGGGTLVGEGSPEHLATLDTPTGRALAALPAFTGVHPELVADASPLALAHTRPTELTVEGATKHNLQGIDVSIPHGSLTVITGPSGSGKTSLAFDTIFAEGQRQYVESLSTYARRFLGRLERAPVERLEGIQPAIAIDQGSASHNPRSTVATVTEIHDVLRLLYARIGQPHCPHCGEPLTASTPSRAAAALIAAEPGAGWLLTRLPPDDEPAERRRLLQRDGWRRLYVEADGTELDLDDPACDDELARGALLVVDRVRPSPDTRARLSEAMASAYQLGHGRARFDARRGDARLHFTEGLVCPTHGDILPELTPRHFSFNSRLGMCPTCEGLGSVKAVLPEQLLADAGTLEEAVDTRVWKVLTRGARTRALLEAVLRHHDVSPDDDVATWPAELTRRVLEGFGTPLEVTFSERRRGRPTERTETLIWPGLVGLAMQVGARGWAEREIDCPSCRGGRLRPASLAVTLGGRSIHAFAQQTVVEARAFVADLDLSGEHDAIAERPRFELERRLRFLDQVGLGYLRLDRSARSLSGGESQRIRLASQLGAGLTGVTYVLDEPTIGLHPRDTGRLLDTLVGLRDQGNTVVVVEHDPDTIRRADHVVDMGPAAGSHGGRVVATGTPAQIARDPSSITGDWLSGRRTIEGPEARRTSSGSLTLVRPRTHNLDVEAARIPLGVWTTVTGVSGAGKSSLIMDTLAPALQLHLGQDTDPGPYDALKVDGEVDGVVLVDQSPIGRSPRSTPATYVKVMDKLRALFAKTRGAMERGWKKGRFSFNAKKGRCEHCEGRGAILIEMHFLPDVWITCPECKGRRFSRETLEVRWKGHSIADVLAMRADEALEVFTNQRAIRRRLQALVDVGLGYMTLGQPSTTLSGGEAQRVKLASELVSRKGRRVYILDEPTTGLHLGDVAQLVTVLHRLVDQGHTVITIEHHLDMIKAADHVIELGPEGGEGGGRIVAEGPPEAIAHTTTATGTVLAAS